jgi:transposase InsO family protein
MRVDLPLKALERALKTRRLSAGLVHHSDRGSQRRFKRSSQHLLES